MKVIREDKSGNKETISEFSNVTSFIGNTFVERFAKEEADRDTRTTLLSTVSIQGTLISRVHHLVNEHQQLICKYYGEW